jgi:Cof subfamily protein (haloacid dehalogenase superfamily)
MFYRALALDVDGTLVCSAQKKITEKTTAALKDLQSRGVIIILATGRSSFASTGAILGADFAPDWRVCVNGALILDAAGRTVSEQRFTRADVENVTAFAESYSLPLNFTFDDAYYVYNRFDAFVAYYTSHAGSVPYLRDGSDHKRHQQSLPYGAYINMPGIDRSLLTRQCPNMKLMESAPGSFDLSLLDVDKRHGVAWVLSQTGIGSDELVAVGDSENDAELLSAAGLGVAMANAPEPIRALAGHVTGSVLEDGVAMVIEQFFGG